MNTQREQIASEREREFIRLFCEALGGERTMPEELAEELTKPVEKETQ